MEGGGCNSGSFSSGYGGSRSTKISRSGCSSISGDGGTHFSTLIVVVVSSSDGSSSYSSSSNGGIK